MSVDWYVCAHKTLHSLRTGSPNLLLWDLHFPWLPHSSLPSSHSLQWKHCKHAYQHHQERLFTLLMEAALLGVLIIKVLKVTVYHIPVPISHRQWLSLPINNHPKSSCVNQGHRPPKQHFIFILFFSNYYAIRS